MINKKSRSKVSLRYRNKFNGGKKRKSKGLFSSMFGKSLFPRRRKKLFGIF